MKVYTFIEKYIICLLLVTYLFTRIIFPTYAYEFSPPELNERLQKLEEDINEKSERLILLYEKSGAFYSDKELEDYIAEVGNRLLKTLPHECTKDISFKMIRDPRINAMAFPNGQIFIHTGIVARLENEAQLAFLLGHEISHVVNKDMLFWLDSYHESTIATKVLDLIIAPVSAFVGLGGLGSLGLQVLYATAVTGYGRENEARADIDGLIFMTNAGYNPNGAVEMFDIFLQEKEKYIKGIEIFFLSSHPSNIYRRGAVVKKIDQLNLKEQSKLINEAEYIKNTENARSDNAYMDIKLDRLQHAIDNLEKFLERNPNNAASHYYIGEVYRLIAQDRERLKHELSYKNWREVKKVKDKEGQKKEWQELALTNYEKAMECDKDYHNSLKGIGFLYKDIGENDKALVYLKKYIIQKPKAKDRRYIYATIKSLKAKKEEIENEENK